MKEKTPQKQHLITLEKKRSIVALIAGNLVLCCALAAILVRLEIYDQSDEPPLHFSRFYPICFPRSAPDS